MMIAPCGTFEYVAVVPAGAAVRADGTAGPWAMATREPVERTGDAFHDDRLVGLAPRLWIAEAGLPPHAPGLDGLDPTVPSIAHSCVAWSRLTLRAGRRRRAQVRAAHLHVARTLTAVLQPGDVLHLARTWCAGLGLSVLRGGRLVAAAGAIHAVPLGGDVSARILPVWADGSLMPHAGAPDDGGPRPAYEDDRDDDHDAVEVENDEGWEMPVELRIGGRTHVLEPGHAVLGDYAVWLGHPYRVGEPGSDECAALARPDACAIEAAVATAQLLARNELVMDSW